MRVNKDFNLEIHRNFNLIEMYGASSGNEIQQQREELWLETLFYKVGTSNIVGFPSTGSGKIGATSVKLVMVRATAASPELKLT